MNLAPAQPFGDGFDGLGHLQKIIHQLDSFIRRSKLIRHFQQSSSAAPFLDQFLLGTGFIPVIWPLESAIGRFSPISFVSFSPKLSAYNRPSIRLLLLLR